MKDSEAFVLINQMIGYMSQTSFIDESKTRKKQLTQLGEWTKKLIRKEVQP
jgi:hypothetical protein|tara:strand:+ start:264 stop:416 length:153 start_codon:yes stop_codon:yes gene_type:complete